MLPSRLRAPAEAYDLTPYLNAHGILDIANSCTFDVLAAPGTGLPRIAALNRCKLAQSYQSVLAPCRNAFSPCGGGDGLFPTLISNASLVFTTGSEFYSARDGEQIARHCKENFKAIQNDFSNLLQRCLMQILPSK